MDMILNIAGLAIVAGAVGWLSWLTEGRRPGQAPEPEAITAD